MILRFLPEGEPAYETEGAIVPKQAGRVLVKGKWWMIHHIEYLIEDAEIIAEIDLVPLPKVETRHRHPDSLIGQ